MGVWSPTRQLYISKHSGSAEFIVPADHLSERPKQNWLRQQTSIAGGSKALYPAPAQLCFLGDGSIIPGMQEVLSRTAEPEAPLQGQEFYELSLLEEANQLGTRYCVRQAHAEWSEIDGQVMWDKEEVDHFWILNEAKQRYEERRIILHEQGFIYSDMDIF